MKNLRRTPQFDKWFTSIKDIRARAKINVRLRRLEQGHYGDCEPVGEGVSELRIFYGPGYRVYFTERCGEFVLLLAGGDKNSQAKDIKRAKAISDEYEG
jgi:putative addiction module killer protein